MAQIINKAERRVSGRVGDTRIKNTKAIVITLLPPIARVYKVIKSDKFLWCKKLKVINIIFQVKKCQIVELYKILYKNKDSVR